MAIRMSKLSTLGESEATTLISSKIFLQEEKERQRQELLLNLLIFWLRVLCYCASHAKRFLTAESLSLLISRAISHTRRLLLLRFQAIYSFQRNSCVSSYDAWVIYAGLTNMAKSDMVALFNKACRFSLDKSRCVIYYIVFISANLVNSKISFLINRVV